MPDPDKRAIACNHKGSKVFVAGALCYLNDIDGMGEDAHIVGRSRGGRWVQTWAALKHLSNFRIKTIPPEHPRYSDEKMWFGDPEYLMRRIGVLKK
jgi:hypothetical protein